MDDLNLDADDLMDLDEHEGGSDLDEEDEDVIDDPLPSPLQLPSSGPASTATSAASSPPTNDEIIAPIFNYSGKPMNIKRGRGRPRRDAGGKPLPRKLALGSGAGGMRMKRWKPGGIGCGTMRGGLKRPKSFDRSDFEFASGILQSPASEEMILDAETGTLVLVDRPSTQQTVPEDPPFCPEQWPGKVCGFCNLSERSQLGQGDMLRLTCPPDFRPQRASPAPSGASVGSSPTTNIATTPTNITPTSTIATNSVSNVVASVAAGDSGKSGQVATGNSGGGGGSEQGDKSPRGPVTCRRQKSFHKSRNPSATNEYIDELAIIGYTEEPDIQMVFDSSGYFYVHRSCALWSQNVEITENQGLENVGQALWESISRKCVHCNHYGASASCKALDCAKVFHYPCATAAAAFQELSSRSLFCSFHLGEVRIACENSVCYTCKLQGDISNLMYCSLCGVHYHGTCVGLAQLPGVRAGWQCRKCKICQVCRMAGDETKLMSCEQCDKVYHAMCQRPIATSIPKYGWKCRCCRVCGDCGSRTPGAGLSSRWHAHYTVCDSCYQQRNKGFCCPICHRAYRAHAHREMVQCTVCRKFVHGTCDPDADLLTYTQRKESHPEYDYVCALCKGITQSGRQLIAKRNSIDEDSMSASQESLYDDMSEFDTIYPEDHMRTVGLGKGKPYSACKIAKKRLGMHSGLPGRPKGVGKGMGSGGPGCVAGKVGYMKRQRMTEFGRKRGTKYKMRGMFGVPGVGLQKPVGDSKSAAEEEPGIENKMILCSAKDKFVLTQDLCVMCGAIGTDQEGCLIACVQCGQCYHPYCVNVKVTKIILQKGWRCLDCTVCEGCGQRNDESRLTLCDDCDISYHIYCMEPPLDYVPHGNWKCRWCAQCQRCGSTDPGFNCTWMNSFNECGPCASHTNCPVCMEGYSDGELILQCVQCERWLHGICDSIKNDSEAERCAEEGYNCILCRPRDVPPPHLLPVPVPKPPTPTKSPEVKPNTYYYMDGVCLTDAGNNQIKSLNTEHVQARKKRTKRLTTIQDKEAGIMATIEYVIAGGNGDGSLSGLGLMDEDGMNDDDRMDESELYKEGMLWMKEDGPPPQGFTIYTMENGAFVLRRKRQRNLQKLGIGGFLVRVRGIRTFGPDATDDVDTLPGQQSTVQSDPLGPPPSTSSAADGTTTTTGGDKPRRKPIRRKPKSKLSETFPLYLQEAFFGREILECGRREELLQLQGIGGERSSDGSDDDTAVGDKMTERKEIMDRDKTIQLSQDELKAVAAVTAKQEQRHEPIIQKHDQRQQQMLKEQDEIKDILAPKEEDESDSEFSLAFPKELLGTDIDKLMSEDISELTKDPTLTDDTDMPLGDSSNSKDTKDELSDILGSHFNLPNINSKDVEDIFKGVLTDESQESQESTTTTNTPTSTAYPHLVSNTSVGSNSNSSSATSAASLFASATTTGPSSQQSMGGGGIMGTLGRPGTLPGVVPQQVPIQQAAGNLQSPMSFPPPSPYHSEYSNSPQFSPAFSEPPSPWINHHGPGTGSGSTVDPSGSNDFLETTTSSTSLPPSIASSTHNQRSSEKMKADEGLGSGATISAVLYANMNHTEWRTDFPSWSDRYKQIIKKWRTLSTEQKAPYLQQAKDNRAALRIKKQSQGSGVNHPIGSNKADSGSGSVSGPGSTSTTGTGGTGTSTGSGSASASPIAVAVPASATTPSPAAPPTPSSTPSVSPTATLLATPPPQVSTTGPVGTQLVPLAPLSEDQEKIAQQHKTAREAEQERQWKQLQAMRQQQAQQQQHNIHEQRVQAIVRVQRQLSEGAPPGFMTPEPQPGTVDSPGVGSPGAGGPEVNRQLRDLLQFKKLEDQLTPGKANQRVWPPHATENTTGQQELLDSVGIDQQQQHQQQMDGTFRQPLPPSSIGRPRMVAVSAVGPPVGAQAAAAAAAAAAGALRGQGVLGAMRMPMDPRMRLMLQQQQLQRTVLQPQQPQQNATLAQYQQQPGLVQQQRFGLPQIQTQLPQTGPRTINADQYELLQQRNNAMAHQQQFVAQQPQLQAQQRPQLLLGRVGMIQIGQSGVNLQPTQQHVQQQQLVQPQQSQGAILPAPTSVQSVPSSNSTDPSTNGNDPGEIPDNVTAELEKLEQEGGGEAGDEPGMEEIQGVGDFFGVGDHDDDDELLAEMGADFNILEYADPELDALAGGEKTNILDSLDLVEPEPQQQRQRQENKVQIKKEEPSVCQLSQQRQQPLPPPLPPQSQPTSTSLLTTQPTLTSISNITNNSVTTSTPSMLTMIKQEHPPPLQPQQQLPQPQQHQPTSLPNQHQSSHPQLTATNIPQQQQQSNLPPLPPLTISQPQQQVQVQQLSIQQQQQHLLQQQQQILHQQQQLQQQQHLPQQIPVSVQHQVHQQFLQQLQQAAAAGRPIQAGTKMMLPDGVTGVLLPNNNISISFPPNYNQKILQIQQQKIQVRLNQLQLQAAQAAASGGSANPRLQLQPHQQLLIHHQGALQQQQQQRLQQLPPPQQQQVPPPPPPPPYPGPPPPYPGNTNQMMSGGGMPYPPHHPHHLVGMEQAQAPLSHHDMIVPSHQPLPPPCPSPSAVASPFYHHGGPPMTPPRSRPMPLLLEEQPLLLEDLLEQEKRELEKQQGVQQQQSIPASSGNQEVSSTSGGPTNAGNSLLSDHDFERLRADVLNTSPNMLPAQQQQPQQRQTFPSANLPPRPPPTPATPQPWQQPPPLRQTAALPQQPSIGGQSIVDPTAPRPIATFQAHLLAAPPLPPEHIVTEQDRQTQMAYEHWLNHQNAALAQQLKYYETEVQKLRKSKKSLNSKQRQLRKTGGQLTEPDAAELQRISSDQSALQKHLESSRKQSRQHGMLIQEYQTKHMKQLQPSQQPQQSQVQLLPQHGVQQVAQQQMITPQQQQSPLGRPASSPIHQAGMGTPHSPVIHSPSTTATISVTSPMMLPQQSPMHSPSPHLISHSPGSSANQQQQPPPPPAMQSSPGGAHGSITSSPRIGTPLSQQGDNSPVASPGGVGVYLPPPPIRMTSPQHRRVVTSPLGYGDGSGVVMRPGTPAAGVVMQARFIRPQLDQAQLQQQQLRMRLQQSPQGPGFPQKPGTPSPLNSPPPQQQQQQYIQRQLQQQVYLQQQPQQQQPSPSDEGLAHSQRTQQLIQQRQLIFKQQAQHLAAQQLQQILPGAAHQPAALTPQQHQFMVQQQQQLHKQQVARLAQQQVQGVQQVQAPPSSPMPPQSPLQHQIMSPHSMQQGSSHSSQPASPMPPRSPMVVGAYQQQPPSSPMMPRSPAVAGQIQQMQQQPPSSPMQMQGGVTSPMMTMMPSPMGHRRPPSVANLSSPAMPERPVSVENPGTPRTPYAAQDHTAMDEQQQYSSLSQHCVSTTQPLTTPSTTSGGGNANNPSTPIPFPPCFGRFGSFKFGLRGGAPPMWPGNTYTIRPARPQAPTTEEASFSLNQSTTVTSSSSNVTSNIPIPSVSVINITHSGGLKVKKESHRSKVTILKKNSPVRTTNMALLAAQAAAGGSGLVGAVPRRMQSLVSMDYNEFDDSSSTPPVTPPPSGSGLNRFLSKTSGKRIPEKPPTPTTISIAEPTKEVLIVESPSSSSGSAGKQQVEDIVDYDDDNDNNLVSTEVTLSDAAQQNDGDEMTVIETFSQSDLADVMSSHLESHQIADDFIFFDMPAGDQYSDKEDADEDYSRELEGMGDKDNTHIINVAIQSPTSSEEELILQGKAKQLSMDMVQGLSAEHLLAVSETPDSPEQEEMNMDPPDSPETTEETITPFEDAQIVIIGQPGTSKSLEEQISTKEDFEELIDEGSRKEKLVKHKSQITYSTTPANVFNFNSKQLKSITTTGPSGNIITTTVVRPNISVIPPKISLIRPPNIVTISKARSDLIVAAQNLKGNTINISSSSLPIKGQVRTMPKLVPTSTHAITIVGASNSQIAQILPSRFTAPVISASVISKLSNSNVKLIEKPSSSLSLSTASHQETTLPNKIFEDDSVSPDSSNNEEDKKSDEADTPTKIFEAPPPLVKSELTITNVKVVNVETKLPEKQEPKMEILKPITTPSTIIHHPPPPELKMTAQIIEGSPPNIASNADVDSMDCGSTDDTKSVVISIPSPTPSQEQYLTNLSLQELENDRREGNRVDGEFESFEDVLDMIENYAGAESSLRESLESKDNLIKAELERVNVKEPDKVAVISSVTSHPVLTTSTEMPVSAITLTTTNRLSVIPQLSPLSQPTELTTNITNVSQQLRTLLSNLQTTSSNTTNVIESVVRNSIKEKTDPPPPKLIPVTPQAAPTISVLTTSVSISQPMITSTVLMPNKPKVMLVTSTTSPPLGGVSNVCSTLPTPSMTAVVTTSVSNQHPALSSLVAAGRIPLTEHPKLAPLSNTVPVVAPPIIATSIPATLTTISMPASSNVSNSNFPGSLATVSSSQVIHQSQQQQQQQRKPLLSLNAMLQSHPAATVSQSLPGTISAASILGSSAAIMKASFSPALAQAQPHVAVNTPLSQLAAVTTSILNISTPSAFVAKSTIATSNLLHSQLTKSPIVRPPKPEEEKKDIVPKSEPLETQDCPITTSALLKTQDSNKFTPTPVPPNRMEDSQNVLLKQLLQNTTCASSQSAVIKTEVLSSTTPPATAPNLPLVPNLEAQLARPVSPIPTSLLPPILQQNEQYNKVVTRAPIMSRETSFVSKPVIHSNSPALTIPPPVVTPTVVPIVTLPQTPIVQQYPQQLQQSHQQQAQVPVLQPQSIVPPQQILPNQQLHIDIKKCGPPSRTPSRDEILSPPTPRSSCSQDSSLQTPPLVIKKEIVTTLPTPQQSPIFHPQEVKKEFIEDTSQHSEISDHSKSDIPVKEEMDDIIDADRLLQEKEEAKKQKRRMYQQKRRQNQIMKETAAAAAGITAPAGTPAPSQPKKRPRKTLKIDEDYDSYIESVLNQIRQLPPLNVSEPILTKNFLAVPLYGCGDLSKITSPDFDPRFGDLTGKYGDAVLPDYTDYYDTKPYGDLDPLPEKPPVSTQRGFYDQEFPLIRFEENKRFDQFARDDTPDSIVSCSSPEPTLDEQQKPTKSSRFPGLGLINEDDDDDDEVDTDGITPQITGNRDRLSPVVPLITPIPIRLKPTAKHLKDLTTDMGKENLEADLAKQRAKNSSTPLKDNAGNVTVTLTLTSSAAEDIMGVLRDLANILQIPAPTTYQIVERTTSPPSQKLGLYRTKGKDGKEGAPIDIQSILNGAAKFCRHCDVVILNNMIKKRFSELPFLSKELATEGDELYFCSSTCYMQFALMHRSPSISEDKAAAIVDHICQKDPNDPSANLPTVASAILEKQRMDKLDILLNRRDSHSLFKDIPTVGFDLKRECIDGNQKLSLIREVAVEAKAEKPKSWRGTRYKIYTADCLQPSTKFKRATDKEIMEMMYRLRITVMPTKIPDDSRRCMFCHNLSDAVADGAGRLLNYDADRWIHLNCGLWSDGVYETVNGALMNIPTALKHSLTGTCANCQRSGATVRCFKTRCGSVYHLGCAVKDGCTFYKNKSVYCSAHVPKGEKENELTTLSVSRRVYVDRDENSQVATVMHHSDLNHLLRVGSLIFLSVGQLLPHQLPQFHTPNYIFPIGYKIIRFYWSMRRINKRCRYICSIHEVHTKPEFRVLVQEPGEEDVEFRGNSCKSVWLNVLDPLATLRREGGCVRIFPRYVSGEDLFGLTEPAVVRVLESLPGIETLSDYKFKYGRNPLLELPLAINPSGAARTEAKLRNQLHWKRPHTQRTTGNSSSSNSTTPTHTASSSSSGIGSNIRSAFLPGVAGPSGSTTMGIGGGSGGTALGGSSIGEAICPYSKQFVHSKSSQYKKMKQEWRNNVYLARSKIQGLGLYAARDLEKHTMVIEYIGEIIRAELAETRERKYEARNRGIYMFRLDEERVVDASESGGLARYINHSCNPNCVAEIVEVERDLRIIIFAKRRILRGEELAYDYKFDIEDDQHKISCMCGAPNCRKWMN